tara:strand:- start:167 stop:469 length:303 start_codon:yes stop_codon:yes gene_type:complete
MASNLVVSYRKNFLNKLLKIMSSEIHKYIETAIEKNLNANPGVIYFPKEKKTKEITNLNKNNYYVWKITDKSNDDQLKAVTGICLMLGALIVMGLYSNLL